MTKTTAKNTGWRALLGAGAVACMIAAPAALAQPMEGGQMMQGAQGGNLMQQLQAKRNEVQQLNQQLLALQEQVIEENPELAEQRDDLQEYLEVGMKDAGYDVSKGRGRIEDLQSDLQSSSLSQAEKQESQQALREELGDMREARGEAMQDAGFKEKREALNEDMLAAMREKDPQVDAIIRDLQVAQREYQLLAQKAMQQQGGAAPSGQ